MNLSLVSSLNSAWVSFPGGSNIYRGEPHLTCTSMYDICAFIHSLFDNKSTHLFVLHCIALHCIQWMKFLSYLYYLALNTSTASSSSLHTSHLQRFRRENIFSVSLRMVPFRFAVLYASISESREVQSHVGKKCLQIRGRELDFSQ